MFNSTALSSPVAKNNNNNNEDEITLFPLSFPFC